MKKKFDADTSFNNATSATDTITSFVLSYDDAKALASDPLNGVEEILLNGKMAILPGDLQQPAASISHLLDAKLFYYLPTAEGILLAYKDIKVTCRLAATFNDRPFAHISYSGKAVVFRPKIGRRLRGVVSQLSSIKQHVTCVLCGVLNVTIPLIETATATNTSKCNGNASDMGKEHSTPYAPSKALPAVPMPSLRVRDVICFELSSHTIAPNGMVSLIGRRCDVKDLPNGFASNGPLSRLSSDAKPDSIPNNRSTWLSSTQQTPRRICFDSSSSSSSSSDSSSSDSSDSESGSSDEEEELGGNNPAVGKASKPRGFASQNKSMTESATSTPSLLTPATVVLSATTANGRGSATNELDSATKHKRKHLGEDNQNSCATPTLQGLSSRERKDAMSDKLQSSGKIQAKGNNVVASSPSKSPAGDVSLATKLEPTTPSRTDFSASEFDHKQGSLQRQLHHQQQQQHERHKSAKKRKYLAD